LGDNIYFELKSKNNLNENKSIIQFPNNYNSNTALLLSDIKLFLFYMIKSKIDYYKQFLIYEINDSPNSITKSYIEFLVTNININYEYTVIPITNVISSMLENTIIKNLLYTRFYLNKERNLLIEKNSTTEILLYEFKKERI
jgi:hypothetical protein